ncbi:MAG: NADH-quinone oxidoreductase subunit H [Chitinophagaceae bacterium]|nr:NADH-quinone oxidoreductase subunit NuoH [Chitinophagaceae bacterium]MCZ2299009.1 NADH-quinone oxidoreductase subunit NuoH [Chitinophagales bacterium]
MTVLTIDWILLIEKLALIIIIIFASLGIALYTTFAERKVAAILQDRPGPNRAGPFGILQPLADGVKMFTKEEIIPTHANKWLFILGPGLAMVASLMTCAVIPWGGTIELFERKINLQVADVNIAILYIFAVVSLGIYGIMIGGWASNNKFSLMAVLRAASQAISYELAMGLSLIAVLMITGTLSLGEMVKQQQAGYWNIVYQPLGFLIFFICALAECNRTPFDLPEAESELNFGYHQEYSSMKLGFYLFAEYINMIMSSAVMATLYFGGYDIPFVDDAKLFTSIGNWAALIQVAVILTKIVIFIFVFMWIRWTIPRFRYDQLMNLGWKKMIPLALFNMLITAFIVLLKHNGWKF